MQSDSFQKQVSIWVMTDLLPSRWKQSEQVLKKSSLCMHKRQRSRQPNTSLAARSCLHLPPFIKTLSRTHTCMNTHAVYKHAYLKKTRRSERHRRLSLLLTKATVRSAVATSAVTHFLAGGCDQSTRALILARVRAAHWTHEGKPGHILLP